jgi:uncharacterized protein with FMN-binding domain
MKKALKRIGIGFLIFVAVIMVYAVLGLQQTLSLQIGPADLTQLPDGEYAGQYDCYRWSNGVKVSVKDHRIMEIAVVQGAQGREGIRRELTDRILQAQSPAVDAVSGATADSKAFLKAVEIALQSGR